VADYNAFPDDMMQQQDPVALIKAKMARGDALTDTEIAILEQAMGTPEDQRTYGDPKPALDPGASRAPYYEKGEGANPPPEFQEYDPSRPWPSGAPRSEAEYPTPEVSAQDSSQARDAMRRLMGRTEPSQPMWQGLGRMAGVEGRAMDRTYDRENWDKPIEERDLDPRLRSFLEDLGYSPKWSGRATPSNIMEMVKALGGLPKDAELSRDNPTALGTADRLRGTRKPSYNPFPDEM
jgi:hypothetical protein